MNTRNCSRSITAITHFRKKTPDVTITTHKRTVDKASMSLVPNDDGLENLFPCLIYGDGNCLPRCGSLFAYGTENKHLDIRARIVLHLVKYIRKFI